MAAGNAVHHLDFSVSQALISTLALAAKAGGIKTAGIGVAHQAIGPGAMLCHLALQGLQFGQRHPALRIVDQVLQDPGKPHTAALAKTGRRYDTVIVLRVMESRHGAHAPPAGTTQVVAVELFIH